MKAKNSMYLLLPMCATVLLGSLASCGHTDDVPVDAGTIRGKIVRITLKSSTGQDKRPYLESFVKSFREIEPNIRVKLEYPGGGYDGVASSTISDFQTGKHGDLVVAYPDAIADFMKAGFEMKLDSYINHPEYGFTEDELADYIPGYMEEGQLYVQNGTWSMPWSKSTEVLFYDHDKLINKTIPGINNDEPITVEYMNSLTWEKLFTEFCPSVVEYTNTTAGRNFINKSNKEKGWGVIGYDSDANFFITLAQQYGYPYTSVNKDTGTGSFDFYGKDGADYPMVDKMVEFNEYKKNHYFFTNNTISERPNNLFTKNQCLLSIGSTAGVKYQWDKSSPKHIAVAPVPQAEGRDMKVISQGPSMAFLRHKKDGVWDKDRELASWLFYKHITSQTNAAKWAVNANYLPIRYSTFEDPAFKRVSDSSLITDITSLKALSCRVNELVPSISDAMYTTPAFKGSKKCREEIDVLVGECMNVNKKTPEETKAEVIRIFDEHYNKINL